LWKENTLPRFLILAQKFLGVLCVSAVFQFAPLAQIPMLFRSITSCPV
jgi:hypothetical protein